jgi:hypothetical protein
MRTTSFDDPFVAFEGPYCNRFQGLQTPADAWAMFGPGSYFPFARLRGQNARIVGRVVL